MVPIRRTRAFGSTSQLLMPWKTNSRSLPVIDLAIAAHNGRLVKTIGDGLLIEFTSVDPLHAATKIRIGMVEQNAAMPQDERIEFRIGLNVGDDLTRCNTLCRPIKIVPLLTFRSSSHARQTLLSASTAAAGGRRAARSKCRACGGATAPREPQTARSRLSNSMLSCGYRE